MARVFTIMTVLGARPQFVKAAAVSHALAGHPALAEKIVHTGQHHDPELSQVFFDELAIPEPAYRLGIAGGGHGAMTGRMLMALEEVMTERPPDLVLVYGDTNSTLAGALVAAKLGIPVAHVEAGLRSFNRAMPEEINRILTDHASTLLFCPTRLAVANLAAEGVTEQVVFIGDVMCDMALVTGRQARRHSTILQRLGLMDKGYALATIHRAENTNSRDALAAAIDYLRQRANSMPVVLPLHPRTNQSVKAFGLSLDGLRVVPPIGYLDFTRLIQGAAEVLTDSGGLQKEAYFHGVPCVTLRAETEWRETIECGWNRLWQGPDYQPRRAIDEYGDGHAADKIVAALTSYFSEA